MSAFNIFYHSAHKLFTVNLLTFIISIPHTNTSKTILPDLIKISCREHCNKISLFCHSTHICDVKKGFSISSPSMKCHHQWNFIIPRCHRIRNIFIPFSGNSIYLYCMVSCTVLHWIPVITKQLISISAMSSCRANILPDILQFLNIPKINSLVSGYSSLSNQILINFACFFDVLRKKNFRTCFIIQWFCLRLVFLLPVRNYLFLYFSFMFK